MKEMMRTRSKASQRWLTGNPSHRGESKPTDTNFNAANRKCGQFTAVPRSHEIGCSYQQGDKSGTCSKRQKCFSK